MNYDIRILFLLFLMYSFTGWAIEVIGKLIEKGKFVNRGFLVGPYCPIYGVGCISMILLLNRYINDPFTLFIMSILLFSFLEYFTSYFMEKIFHARWWDYSKRKFNINGRICLETLLPFGIMGCLILYIVNPAFLNIYEKMPNIALHIICGILLAVYITDNIISGKIISNLKEISVSVKDNTEEISKKVKKIITQKSGLHRRLVEAFPNIKAKVNLKDWITKGEEKINELKNRE